MAGNRQGRSTQDDVAQRQVVRNLRTVAERVRRGKLESDGYIDTAEGRYGRLNLHGRFTKWIYRPFSCSHDVCGEQEKSDEKKRGRFNVGEKHVLALCDKATITSITGRVLFLENGTRRHDKVKTKVGTQFRGELPLTQEEFDEMAKQARLVIPPIPTFFNGEQIPFREVLHKFETTLPTEIADDKGISRLRNRKTTVRLFKPFDGEKPMLYELGMPVVEIDCLWHVDIGQKVPLNIERDNVNPSYLTAIFSAILEQKGADITDEEAAAAWVTTALENKKDQRRDGQDGVRETFRGGCSSL